MPAAQLRRASSPSPAARAVTAAFKKAVPAGQASRSVPASLLERRRQRAEKRLVEALEARGPGPLAASVRARMEALVSAWAAKDFGDGFEEAERFEEECFAAGELAEARQSGDEERLFQVLEEKHRAEVVKEHGKIELRGLQMSARVYQDLDKAYVPLRIEDESQKGEVIEAGNGIQIRTVPRLSVGELLARHERAVLVGAPGSGKSTIVAWVASMAASGRLQEESPVPFVVPVRSLKGDKVDAEAIAEVGCSVGLDFVRRVLAEKRALVLVDGLDEAHRGAEGVGKALQGFVKAYPGNRVLVTTRPAGPAGSDKVEVPGFASTRLLPMGRDEVYVFIERWCRAAEASIQKDPQRAEDDARRAYEDLKARVETSRPVEKLAETPLMCSVLCIVHRFLGQRVPERRVALYDACTNVLLYEWDKAKFSGGSVVGELDAQDKKFLLGGVARSMHEQGVAEIPEADLIRGLQGRLPDLRREASEATAIVGEIRDRSGLLVERRPGYYAFSHLTFQEYLCAVEFVRVDGIQDLFRHLEDTWWHEVIVLAAGLPGGHAARLVRHLLSVGEHGGRAPAATLLAAQCAESAIELPNTVRQEVERRLGVLVPPRNLRDAQRLARLGDVAGPVLLSALRGADPYGRALICVALSEMKYLPAASALARMMADSAVVSVPAPRVVFVHDRAEGGDGFGFYLDDQPVARVATVVLFKMCLAEPSLRPTFERALATAPPEVVHFFLTLPWTEENNAARDYQAELAKARSAALAEPSATRAARSG